MSGRFVPKPIKEIEHIQNELIAFGQLRGWFIEKVKSLSRNGFPDLFCARRGVIMLLECKKDDKTEPGAQQLKRHRELRDQGVIVHVVQRVEDGYELLR